MERFKIITNTKGKYPIYVLIDSITGQLIQESENLASLKDKQSLFNEWHNI
jgi:hypothetical protein